MIRNIIFITLFLTVLIHGTTSQGRNPDKGRIVGGYPIDITSRPFQVALYTGGGFCGGSIISTTKIVTAAHCLTGKSASQLTVYAGSSHRSSGGVIRYVSYFRVHPSYNPSVSNNFDIAVLTFGGPLTANGGLAGVVSFGYGCALAGYAGVYASVPELRSWILAN
uniref:CSON007176 protein n=1 Tax=Culicoides sonorensis TaxID=179676 RepID=A0A336LAX2_CULSO